MKASRHKVIGAVIAGATATGLAVLVAPNAFAADLAWTSTETPNPHGRAALYDAEALTADDVWAVGNTYGEQDAESIIAHWDGEQWTETEHPRAGVFMAVDATAADNVWAVGQGSKAPFDHGYTTRWDGEKWAEVPAPELPTDSSTLSDVSALDDGTAWAGGVMTNEPDKLTSRNDPGRSQSKGEDWEHTGFVQYWDGSEWTVVEAPVPDGAEHVNPYRVHALSSDELLVAGDATDSDGMRTGWVARYAGGEWNTIEIPDVESTGPLYAGIVETGGGEFVIGGNSFEGETPHPLLLDWDGEELTRTDFPETEALIESIALDGESDLLLTGGEGIEIEAPLVMRYSDGELSSEAVPETDDHAYLVCLETVPETSTTWAVGANTDEQGAPTGSLGAYTG